MIVTVKGVEVDVIKSSINPTFQSNDLNEIRNRNLSNTRLKFPKTPRNMEVFDYLGAQGSLSRVPYDIVKCEVRQGNNIQLKGVLKITSDNGDYFEGILKEEAGDIFDLIKDKDLKDLDFSDINHYLINATYSGAVNSTDGYVYPIADYGAGIADVLEVATQSPHLFKHYLWSKIWSEAGAYYSGVFFDNENYKSEVISMARGQIGVGKPLIQFAPQTKGVNYSVNAASYDYSSIYMPLIDNFTFLDERLSVREDGSIEVLGSCKARIHHLFGSTSTVLTPDTITGGITSVFNVNLNGASIYNQTSSDSYVFGFSWVATTSHTVNLYRFLTKGDIITFTTDSSASNSSPDDNPVSVDNVSEDSTIEILEPYIDFTELIGEMSQTAFIKDVISANGLMFKTVPSYATTGDSSGLVYEFVTMEDLLNDRAGAEDWSSKKSYTKVSKRSVGSYGLNNRLEYKYAEDVVPFLDYNHVSTNLNQSVNNDLNKSAFEVSVVGNSFLGVETLNPVMFEFIEVIQDPSETQYSYYKALEVVNRNAKVKLYSKTFTINDGYNSTPVEVSGLVSYLTNERVEMDFYFERYFEAFSRIIDTPIKDTMAIYLTPLDVERLDFFKLKYSDQDGRYYYLNKVTKFKEGINTLCELVTVVTTEVVDYTCTDYQYNNFATTIYTP